jgi:hypothetical protein
VVRLLWLALALTLASPPLVAAEDWSPFFPDGESLDWKQLAARLTTIQVGGDATDPQPVDLVLPAGTWWRLPSAELEPDTRRLAGFVRPGEDALVKVEVLRHRLEEEVEASDWLLALLVRGGVTVLRARPANGAAGQVFEVLGLVPGRVQEGPQRLLRASVLRQGRDLLVVRCLASPTEFADLAPAFAASTLLLRPEEIKPETVVGEWNEECLAGGICLRAPGARKFSESPGGSKGQGLVFALARQGVLGGRMVVELVEDPTLAAASPSTWLGRLQQRLADEGLDLAWSWSGMAINLPHLPGKACLYQGRASRAGRDAECQALFWSDGRRVLTLWLAGAGQLSNLPFWLVNRRAFNLACAGLRSTAGQ